MGNLQKAESDNIKEVLDKLEIFKLDNDKVNLVLDSLRTYIDGKLKRLNLLFAVNGGAFAIAKLSLDSKDSSKLVLIPIKYLAVGAIIFTIVMICDTWIWAWRMKKGFLGPLGFNLPGQIILGLLGLLLIAAWSWVYFTN